MSQPLLAALQLLFSLLMENEVEYISSRLTCKALWEILLQLWSEWALESVALESASWPGRDHEMQPKQSPEQQPSSPVSTEESPCRWRSAAMSRGPCVEAAADLGGSRSPWESMALGGEEWEPFPLSSGKML